MEIIVLGLLLLVGIPVFFFIHRESHKEVSHLSTETKGLREDLKGLTQELAERFRDQNFLLHETQRHLGERLEGASRVVGEVQNRLGRLESASQQIYDLGKEIKELESILKAPKLRGIWSEFFLEELLAQAVPKENFILQYTFRSGHQVDAVLVLSDGLVPIDAKFPLENFKRILDTQNEEVRRQLKTAFAADVKKHIDAIHEKYILPNEGTFDFALMYIPAENVYYEILSGRDEVLGAKALAEYARTKKVIPVSPSTFFSYLQTILLGLKGMRIEQSAREVLEHLGRLKNDFSKFMEEYRLLGSHIKNVRVTYERSEKTVGRFQEGLAIADRGAESLPVEKLQLEEVRKKVPDEELV